MVLIKIRYPKGGIGGVAPDGRDLQQGLGAGEDKGIAGDKKMTGAGRATIEAKTKVGILRSHQGGPGGHSSKFTGNRVNLGGSQAHRGGANRYDLEITGDPVGRFEGEASEPSHNKRGWGI